MSSKILLSLDDARIFRITFRTELMEDSSPQAVLNAAAEWLDQHPGVAIAAMTWVPDEGTDGLTIYYYA